MDKFIGEGTFERSVAGRNWVIGETDLQNGKLNAGRHGRRSAHIIQAQFTSLSLLITIG